MFSKNKLLLILFIFIIILSFFTNSFASYDFTFNDKEYSFTYDIGDKYSNYYYLIMTSVDGQIQGRDYFALYVSETPMRVDDNHSINSGFKVISDSDVYSTAGFIDSSFDVDFEHPWPPTSSTGRTIILNSNYNVYNLEGDLVFQVAPVTVEQVTIPEIQQVGEIPQVIAEVLKILIPIGLIVLSIGLVIYLTRLVISRLQ